jgi:hypothetical protein
MRDEPGGLDELSEARLAEGRSIMAGVAGEHDQLLAAAVAERDEFMVAGRWGDEGPARRALEAWEVGDRLAGLTAEQLRCLLFALAERLAAGGEEYSPPADWFAELTDRPLSLVAGDLRLLAAVAEPGAKSDGYRPFEFVVDMVEQLLSDGAVGAAALADAVAEQVLGWNPMVYHWYSADAVLRGMADSQEWDGRSRVAELRDAVLELAGRPPALPVLEGAVSRDDGYGLAVIGWLGVVEDWPPGVASLLAHCATARTARPGPRWEKVCRQRLAAVSDPSTLLRHLLELLLSTEPVRYLTDSGRQLILVGFNEQLIRGVVWAAGLLDPPWLPDVLRAVAARCLRLCSGHVFRHTVVQGEKIPYACFRSLAASGSDASLIALARIGRATSNGSVLKQLARTLEEVSARRGMSPASLLDQLTPDHGLSPDGRAAVVAGAGSWTIRLDDRHGAVPDGPPGAAVLLEVADTLGEIKATVSATRARLEALFADRREWHVDDFADSYVRHPLVGWLASRLVWTFTPADGQAIRGFPGPGGDTVRTPQGTRPVPSGGLVQLTHPVTITRAELGELRRLSADLHISQPIRQLWRETYQLTAAERGTGLYTDRYAGHVLRFAQCYGLARRRGWAGGFLSGAWDGGDSAMARRDYTAAGLRASWAIAQLDDLSHEVAVDLCITERVSFSPLDDTVRTPVPLADVPAEIFSEAMRDLDLVVSVSTVANDPVWLENYRGQPGLDRYWERIAAGGLDQLRNHRREILTPIYGDPGAGARFELTDQELIVKGSLATYRIDLATANVQTEPAGKWLSFDTKPTAENTSMQEVPGVPALDDDEILHRILIRAAILADDEQLASRKLLKQIRG